MKTEPNGRVPSGTILPACPLMAGIGLRRQASAREILALLDAALAEAGLGRSSLAGLVTFSDKADHPALQESAAILGVPLRALARKALDRPVPNPSGRVAARLGLSSIAEAAALAFGPLVVEKRRSANATCALSRLLPAYGEAASKAASTPSTLSASGAGA